MRRVLDIGCGTGDLSLLAARHFRGTRVVGIDLTRAMLSQAAPRVRAGSPHGRVDLGRASAFRLPFEDGSFDVVMSAFVARTIPRLPATLPEARRVLAPGGTLLCLEITSPESPSIRRLVEEYCRTFVPLLGGLVRSRGPSRYLAESLRQLPEPSRMLDLLRSHGFDRVAAIPQSFGIATSFLGGVGPC